MRVNFLAGMSLAALMQQPEQIEQAQMGDSVESPAPTEFERRMAFAGNNCTGAEAVLACHEAKRRNRERATK